MQRRHVLLGLALIATLLAVFLAPPAEEPVVAAVSRPAVARPAAAPVAAAAGGQGARAASAATVMPLRARERDTENEPRLLAAQSWDAPPAVASTKTAAEPAPSRPQAPPAPVQLMGRYQEGSKTLLFALHNDQSVVLRAGESIGTEWRVDAVDANQVTLTHLPSGQKQSLPWGAAP